MNRPDCFNFAMDFLGTPEDEIVTSYVENLEKQNVMLREAIDAHLNPCGCFQGCEFCNGKHSLEEALAATDDLSGYILCEREPVGYIFQHEDTGRTMCVEAQQVEWNFEKNNPRLFKVGPLYAPKGLNHGN